MDTRDDQIATRPLVTDAGWTRMTAVAEVQPVSSQTDLVRRAARGDALAFERLIATRADGAFRIARAMLGDESDARDATQDAFVSAVRVSSGPTHCPIRTRREQPHRRTCEATRVRGQAEASRPSCVTYIKMR